MLDPKSPLFAEPQLSLLYGQIEDAQQFLIWEVQDCTRSELEYRGPAGDRNSIATLILHIAGCNLQWVYEEMQGRRVPSELTGRFILHEGEGLLPNVVGLGIGELLVRYKESVSHVRAYMLTLTDADLDRLVGNATLRWGFWHLAEHSMLHQGQMRWLRLWYREAQGREG